MIFIGSLLSKPNRLELQTCTKRIGELESINAGLTASNQQMQHDLYTTKGELLAEKAVLKIEKERQAEMLAYMEERFNTVANSVMNDQSERFTQQNADQIQALLAPLKENIASFKQQVERVYDADNRDRSALLKSMETLQNSSTAIAHEARSLSIVLKGDAKVQGAWGEMILAKIFELSGLTAGRDYELQVSLGVENADSLEPGQGVRRLDALVHLPGQREVIVDSKASLKAYMQAAESTTDKDRQMYVAEHVSSIRRHIRLLSVKEYQKALGINTLDFILMFVPSESAYIEALRAAPDLYEEAIVRNIALVSPSTLLPTLKTIANLWQAEQQTKNAKEIARVASTLYDQFVLFTETWSEVGLRLRQAQEAYDTSSKRLSDGRGSLIKKADSLRALGVKPAKKLAAELIPDLKVIEQLEE